RMIEVRLWLVASNQVSLFYLYFRTFSQKYRNGCCVCEKRKPLSVNNPKININVIIVDGINFPTRMRYLVFRGFMGIDFGIAPVMFGNEFRFTSGLQRNGF